MVNTHTHTTAFIADYKEDKMLSITLK